MELSVKVGVKKYTIHLDGTPLYPQLFRITHNHVAGLARNNILYPLTFIQRHPKLVSNQTFTLVHSDIPPISGKSQNMTAPAPPTFILEDLPTVIKIRDPQDYHSSVVIYRDDLQRLVTLKNVLRDIPMSQIASAFTKFAQGGNLDKTSFVKCMESLGLSDSDDTYLLHSSLLGLWHLFDRNQDGCVDVSEFLSGMSVISSQKNALQVAFSLFDDNGDGRIDRNEMFKHIKAIMLMVVGLGHTNMNSDELLYFVDRVAASTIDICFDIADINRDGNISVDEFSMFLQASSQLLPWIMLIFVQAEVHDSLNEIIDDGHLEVLPGILTKPSRFLNKTGKLIGVPIEHCLRAISNIVDNGYISEENLHLLLDNIAQEDWNETDCNIVLVCVNQIFEFLDFRSDGIVSEIDFTIAILLLTQLSVIDRLCIAFPYLDINNDGWISIEEFTSIIENFLRVLFALHSDRIERDVLEREIQVTVRAVTNSLGQDAVSEQSLRAWYDQNHKNLPSWLVIF